MLQGLYFGALLEYYSSNDKTRCVYIKDDNGKAVVILYGSEHPIRVEHEQLGWYRCR